MSFKGYTMYMAENNVGSANLAPGEEALPY